MTESPFYQIPLPSTERYDTHVPEPLVQLNEFLSMTPQVETLPDFTQAKTVLPAPFWQARPDVIDCYWRAWELAFSNLHRPTKENGFISNFCDTAFNGNLFMWDSGFITFFGIYGRKAFNFQRTLDNFYHKQHKDGYICREISEDDGTDTFHRFDPSSTGPNVFPWTEWNHYQHTGDIQRLRRVFPVLLAFYHWFRTYRTWQDGTYYSSGWGCGMDNLPRVAPQLNKEWSHGHLSWIDTTLQAVMMAKILIQMASILQEELRISDLDREIKKLEAVVNATMWDDKTSFYYDRNADGTLSPVKHLGAYWAMLAGVVPPLKINAFVAHLENPDEFNRPHRIPALSADDPNYGGTGNYWCGGIWAPTNYMALKGLNEMGNRDLAHQIAMNHLDNVVRVYKSDDTVWLGADQFREFFHLTDLKMDDKHTLWENYAPDEITPGSHSKPGYVGWTGLPPIAVLFEDIFGIIPDAPANRLTWKIRLLDEHGIHHYPFGMDGILDMKCQPRKSTIEKPAVEIHSNVPLLVDILWEGGKETLQIEPDSSPTWIAAQ
jgi:hypothetical protein